MNYKSFNLGDWIGHISGAIEDERELDGNEMRDLVEFLSELPRWISVTERLPEEQDEYLVTWTAEGFRDKPFIQIIEFDIEDRGWILERYMKEMYRDVIITAWMPLPEPYKGGE